MKTIYTIAFLLLGIFRFVATAQSPNWAWAKSAGALMDVQGGSVSANPYGNIYVTGLTDSIISFGSDTLLTGGFFVAKYDSTGKVIWVKGSSIGNGVGVAIAVGSNGDVYVTGSFTSPTLSLGSRTLTNTNSTPDISDYFIVKYDSSGNVIWAQNAGGTGTGAQTGDDFATNISADAYGNVYVTGELGSRTIILGTTTLTNNGDVNIFIVKYDSTGNVSWAKVAADVTGGMNPNEVADDAWCNGISTDANSNLYITGYFTSPAITLGSTTLNNYAAIQGYAGVEDYFIVKYNSTGNVIWVQGVSYYPFGLDNEPLPSSGSAVTTDAYGNVYVAGGCAGLPFTLDSVMIDAISGGFIVKYDSSGNVIWVNGTGSGDVNAMSIDVYGNIYLTGSFSLNTDTFGSTILTNPSGVNAYFIAKYDSSGNAIWAESAAGAVTEYEQFISIDVIGDVYVGGSFSSNTIAFGSTTLTNTGSSNPSIYEASNIFVAKLGNTTSVMSS